MTLTTLTRQLAVRGDLFRLVGAGTGLSTRNQWWLARMYLKSLCGCKSRLSLPLYSVYELVAPWLGLGFLRHITKAVF